MGKKKLFILLIFDLIYGAGWFIGRFLVKKYVFTGDMPDMVKATQTNMGKALLVTSSLYKWWVIAIVVIVNILVLLSLRGARQTVIVQAPQSVQGTSVQPKTLPCESTQPQLEQSNEMKIF